MTDLSDNELLGRYIAHDDRAAIEELVRRHIGFVYACARRQLRRDPHLADDVTQAVFILLVSKARRLKRDVVLRGWLFGATRYASANALRMADRRRRHEAAAARMRIETDAADPTSDTDQMQSTLNDALASLRDIDRSAVILSFFDNRTHRQIAAAIGGTEEAARKRVHRAMEKMRAFFERQGVSVATPAVVNALATARQSVASVSVPMGLIDATLASAWSATTAFAPAGGATLIAKGANQMILLGKLKSAAALFIAAAIIVSGASISAIALAKSARTATDSTVSAAAPEPKDAPLIARFEDGPTITLTGVMKYDKEETWWNADGSPAAAKSFDPQTSIQANSPAYALAVHIDKLPADADLSWQVGTPIYAGHPAKRNGETVPGDYLIAMLPAAGQTKTDVTCRIAMSPWETLLTCSPKGYTGNQFERGSAAFATPFAMDGGTCVIVSHDLANCLSRVVAFDRNGELHVGENRITLTPGKLRQMTVWFNLPADEVDRFELQIRSFYCTATFKGVSLDPAKRTQVEVEMKSDKD